jgi:hypothetical protein
MSLVNKNSLLNPVWWIRGAWARFLRRLNHNKLERVELSSEMEEFLMKLQTHRAALASALLVSGALGVAAQAHAATSLNIDPTYTPNIYVSGSPPSALDTAEVESLILANFGKTVDLGLVYKQDYGAMTDSGTASTYYSSTFSGDPNNATISWDAGAMAYVACGDCFLVVKDGNAAPYAYIFDISNPGGWDGQGDLNLSNFWSGPGGAISYVAIYNNASGGGGGGGTITPVPEADTYAMLLAGLGLVGFAARRKLSKTA